MGVVNILNLGIQRRSRSKMDIAKKIDMLSDKEKKVMDYFMKNPGKDAGDACLELGIGLAEMGNLINQLMGKGILTEENPD